MTIKIDRKLNLALPVEREDGGIAHVFSTPISRPVFEMYFMTISGAYAAMLEQGAAWLLRMGPRTAKLMLKRIAEAENAWSGPQGVDNGLLGEIRRLTNVLAPLPGGGWDLIPFQEAINKNFFSEEDADEVEQALCFFTVVSASMKRKEATALLEATFGLLDGQITSLDITAYQASLQTSKLAESIGERATQSFIPR